MKLESGPAAGDRNYWLFMTVLCLAFAVWFVYDGVKGWPDKNREDAEGKLRNYVDTPVTLGETPTPEQFDAFRDSGKSAVADLRQEFGEPLASEDKPDATIERYASIWGMSSYWVRNGRIQRQEWTHWAKSKEQIQGQFWWAAIPALIGLYGLFRLVKAVRLRVTLDADGMVYDGKQIAYDHMTDLRDYSRKGWVDLYHKASGDEQRLRIDNQKVDKFEEIVQAICEVKGFENPLPGPEAEAEEATDAAPAEQPASEQGGDTPEHPVPPDGADEPKT